MSRIKTRAALALALCAAIVLRPAVAGGISGGISGSGSRGGTGGAGLSCLNWQPTGICLWLVCTSFGCSVETSIRYGHFNPDVYITHDNGRTQASTGSGNTRSGGERTEGGPGRPDHTFPNHQNLIFKDVNAVGHPLANALYKMSSEFFCQSEANMAQPYFISAADAIGWRYGLPDMVIDIDSWIPGRREIGSWPRNTWGAVMPRSGWATQSDQPKSAAVLAQRAADIFTRSGEPHVYLTLGSGQAEQKYSDDGNQMVWTPPPIEENHNTGGIWQMASPKAVSDCEIFGANDSASLTGWGGGKVANDGEYAFTLWRPYQCCETEGIFIAAFPPADTMYPPPNVGKPALSSSSGGGSPSPSGGTGQ